MKTLPFIIVAALVVAFSFSGLHPGAVQVEAVVLLIFAGVLLVASYVEKPSWWGVPRSVETARSRRKMGLIICGCMTLTLSAAFTLWPLRLSYLWSKDSLSRIAKQVASNGVSVPQEAQMFTVYNADVEKGLICLWIDEDGGEPIGFVRGTPSAIKKNFVGYEIVVLDDEWCHVSSL